MSDARASWYSRFGWSRNPFTLEIKPHLFVGHRKEIEELVSAINDGEKFILVTGPTGAGKTTLLKWLSTQHFSLYFPKPPSNKDELVDVFRENVLKPSLLERIFRKNTLNIYNLPEKFMKKHKNKKFLLLVDEAHESEVSIMEWLRSIGDQIDNCVTIFAGLPKLRETTLKQLETLNQRFTMEMELSTLTKDEMIELVRKRIEDAGGKGIEPFTYEALELIYKHTGGFPREVLKLCNQLINEAIKRNSYVIDGSFFKFDAEEEEKINPSLELESLTDKQREIVELIARNDGLTPTDIVEMIDTTSYKTKMHALRAVNNILRRLERDGMVVRRKKGRTYVYEVTPKIKSLFVES